MNMPDLHCKVHIREEQQYSQGFISNAWTSRNFPFGKNDISSPYFSKIFLFNVVVFLSLDPGVHSIHSKFLRPQEIH